MSFLDELTGVPVSRVLVIAAHPDDETIGAGAQLGSWPGLVIAHATNGSPRDPRFAHWAGFPDPVRYAEARRAEAVAALGLAGITAGQIVQLGFHDQDATTSLEPLTSAIVDLTCTHEPQVIVTHPYEGGHPDHDAVCVAVHHACGLLGRKCGSAPSIVEMTSYSGRGGHRVLQRFLQGEEGVVTFTLDPAQRDLKLRMYQSYRSQYSLLRDFPRDVERFRKAPRYDFTRKPHEGPLFYENFELGMDGERFLRLAGQLLGAL